MPDLALLFNIQARLSGQAAAQLPATQSAALPAVLGQGQAPALPAPARLAEVAELTLANSQVPERYLRRMDQRKAWVWEVWHLAREQRCSEKDAAAVLSRGAAQRYPDLAAKTGRHPLATAAKATRMYWDWKAKLGSRQGQPDWENAEALLDKFARGCVRPPGCTEFREIFMGYHLSEHRPDLAVSYRWASRTYRQRHPLHDSADIPSESAMRRWYDTHVPAHVKARYRMGEEYFKQHYADYVSCDWSRYRVREIWVWDSRVFDSFFRHWDERKQKWVARRAWLVGAVDVRSGWFVGLDILPGAATAWDIEMTWRRAIHNNDNRPPRYIIRDHGSDYEGAGMFRSVTMPGGHETSQAIMLGVQDEPAEVRNARRKVIERLFRDVAKEFDRGQPSYSGNTASDRPTTTEWYLKHPEALPTLQEFTESFVAFLWDWYQRPKQGETTIDLPPLQAWRTAPHILPRLSDEQLAERLLRPLPQPRVVQEHGRLNIDNQQYQSNRLIPFVGQQLMIKVDMQHGGVYAYSLQGVPVAGGAIPVVKLDGLAAGEDELSRYIAHCRASNAEALSIGLSYLGDELQLHAATELWGLPAPDREAIAATRQAAKQRVQAKPLPKAVGDDQAHRPDRAGAAALLGQLQSHEVDIDTEAPGPRRQTGGSALADLFRVIETDGDS